MTKEKIKDYLKIALDTFSLLAKINFTIGFVFVAIYFYHINYFPVGSDYSAFLDLIFIVAFAGIFSLIIMVTLFIISPYNWVNLLSIPDVAHYWFKGDARDIVNCYKIGKPNFSNSIRLHIAIRYFIFTSIYFSILLIAYYSDKYIHHSLSIFFSINFVFIIIRTWFFPSKQESENYQYDKNFGIKECSIVYVKIISFIATSGFFMLIGITTILFLTTTSSMHAVTYSLAFYVIAVYVIVIVASLVCILPPNEISFPIKIWMPIVGTTLTFFLFMFFGLFPNMSSRLISSLKLGSINNITLQVDNFACLLFSQAGYPIQCNAQTQSYFIDNINLQWRLGEYNISFKSGEKTKDIFIPQNHVFGVIVTSKSH